MPLPFAAKALGATAGLFRELVTQPISAELKPRGIALAQRAMYEDPLILPDVGVVIDLLNRQMIDSDLANGLLRNHGVTLYGIEGEQHDGEYYKSASAAWRKVKDLAREIPSVSDYLDLYIRGLMDPVPASRNIIRAGGNPDYWFKIADRMRTRPDVSAVIDAWIRGRLEPPEFDRLMKEAGSDSALWTPIVHSRRALPTVGDLFALRNRELIDDLQLNQYLEYLGFQGGLERGLVTNLRFAILQPSELIELIRRGRIQPEALPIAMSGHGLTGPDADAYTDMLKALPQVADLTMMGIREAFRPELGSVYRYYDEFPELTRPWYAKLGLDYGTGIQLNDTDRPREATLADLYWAAHWHPMPLGQAYLAYQRFQPDLLHRFTEDNPGLKPFGLDDLKLHMRIADLPPGVRDWMVALSHPVLGQRQIQYGAQFLGWSRGEMQSRYRLLGYTTNDAAALASIAEARSQDKDEAWKASLVRRAHTQTVSEIEGMYDEGILTRESALSHLAAAGLPDNLSVQLLDLSDSRRSRSLLRAAIAATGRDYLSGALSAAEATSALSTYGITTARAGELMQIWSIRRSRHRRQADTGKILRWVGQGRMDVAEATRRLSNLGWSQPDVLLLLSDAEGQLAKLQARERKLAESDAAKRARELERLAREAKAAEKRLLAEANRVAPRGVLTRWLIDGVITEAEYRQGMRDRGYPDNLIDDYVRDATSPKASKPRVAPPVKPFPRPEGTVHPGVGVVKKWAKDGVIDRSQFEEMIRGLGYSDSDTARFVADQYPAAP